jgi:ribosome-associated protein
LPLEPPVSDRDPGPRTGTEIPSRRAGLVNNRRQQLIRRPRVILQKSKALRASQQDALAHSRHLLSTVLSSLEDDKADDIVVIELADKSSIADFMVIASGSSTRQVGAMAHHLRDKLKAEGLQGVAAEGLERCDWVLVDGGDVIVHLFRPEVRTFYNLEKMWGANLVPVGGEAELGATTA